MKTYSDIDFRTKTLSQKMKDFFFPPRDFKNAIVFNKKILRVNKNIQDITKEIENLEDLKQKQIQKLRFMQSSLTIHKIGD